MISEGSDGPRGMVMAAHDNYPSHNGPTDHRDYPYSWPLLHLSPLHAFFLLNIPLPFILPYPLAPSTSPLLPFVHLYPITVSHHLLIPNLGHHFLPSPFTTPLYMPSPLPLLPLYGSPP